MIEEAAGTRMYETKKQSAKRTIERKDSKLQEIETVSVIGFKTVNKVWSWQWCILKVGGYRLMAVSETVSEWEREWMSEVADDIKSPAAGY